MKKLFETEKIDSGVYKDETNNLIPLWADGLNVLFTENVVQPFPPHLVLVGKIETNPIAGAVEAIIAGVPNLFFGTATKLYRYISGGGALIEVLAVTSAHKYLTQVSKMRPFRRPPLDG